MYFFPILRWLPHFRRVLRRCPVRVFSTDKVLRRVLRTSRARFIEGALKVLKHVPSQSTNPFACTLTKIIINLRERIVKKRLKANL